MIAPERLLLVCNVTIAAVSLLQARPRCATRSCNGYTVCLPEGCVRVGHNHAAQHAVTVQCGGHTWSLIKPSLFG
jgi:hypothetical protein